MRQFKNVEIILEESQAVLDNSLYIIPVGNGKAKAVVTDANANSVAITSDVPENIATTDYEDVNGQIVSGNAYTKSQTNNLLQEQISLEAAERQNADSAEAQARAAADSNLETQISTEITNRSNADSGLQSQITQNKNDIAGKVDKTTTTITTPDATFKYAYIFDEANNPRRMLAGDLGKNVANSSLTSVSGAGMTMGANWTLNTGGFYYNITNLPDVSNDSTYNNWLVQNSSGRIAKSNGKQLIVGMPSLLSEAEKTTWKTQMNGGWTTNTMSVADIFPPIIKLQNQNSYISIKGANLNLNPANFSISICDKNSTASNPIVLSTINNSQVTLMSATDIAFYYNFNSLGVGEYKLLINNGVSTYLSTYTFLITDNVDFIDLGNITWGSKTLNDVVTTDMQAGGTGILFRPSNSVHPMADEPKYLFKAKTLTPLFMAGEDFYLEFNISFTNISGLNSSSFSFGISSSPNSDNLLNDITKGVLMTLVANQFSTNMSGNSGTSYTSQNVTVVFIKRGTSLIIRSNFNMFTGVTQQKTETVSDTVDFYFMGIFQNMNSNTKTFNISITSAYKF